MTLSFVPLCLCVCVCVRERDRGERERRERERVKNECIIFVIYHLDFKPFPKFT